MDSKEYWKRREEENLKKNLKSEEEYLKELEDIFRYTMSQCQNEIDAFYIRYADKEGISIAAAKKRVSDLDIEEYARKAKKYVKEKDFSDQANREMKIYNLTMKVNRLEMLKSKIGLELAAGFNDAEKHFDKVLSERTLAEFKRQAGILGMTVRNEYKNAKAIVNSSFKNATFSDVLWTHQDLLKMELDKLIRTGMLQGRNPRVLASKLRKSFDASQKNAERLMRTELARVQTEAQKQSYIANGFDRFQFHALGTACTICKDLDEKDFAVEEMTPGDNAPPIHPNCRCSTSAFMDEAEYYNWIDGYSEHGLSFADWKNKQANTQTGGKEFTGGKWYKPYDKNSKKDKSAANAYRKISRRNDISVIASNSGFKEDEIKQIKRHIFFNKHKKYDGYGMLHPDYDMAVAWNRIYEGKSEDRDILLLKHELLESTLEKEYNLAISEAHSRAKREYDWESKLYDDLGEEGEPYGLL